MSETRALSTLLNLPPVSRVRRNHALEHATVQVLDERHRGLRMVGRSSSGGFYIWCNLPTEKVLDAAQEGLRRLQAGQRHMAIHPNCGSNIVVAGVMAGVGTFLVVDGYKKPDFSASGATKPRFLERFMNWLNRLSLACTVATVAIILARPLGTLFQTHVTTQADVGDLRIAGITRETRFGSAVYRIHTEG